MTQFVNLISGKWAIPVLYRLIILNAPVRFGDLLRATAPSRKRTHEAAQAVRTARAGVAHGLRGDPTARGVPDNGAGVDLQGRSRRWPPDE